MKKQAKNLNPGDIIINNAGQYRKVLKVDVKSKGSAYSDKAMVLQEIVGDGYKFVGSYEFNELVEVK